jgi:hypothetical protein
MKYAIGFVIGLIFLASCSGGKEVGLDSSPLLQIRGAYWQEVISGQQDDPKTMILILPFVTELGSYKVDSVYFKGYHEALVKSMMQDDKPVYRTRINIDQPMTAIVPPYAIEENEALVSYIDLEKKKRYFKVSNIEAREPMYLP